MPTAAPASTAAPAPTPGPARELLLGCRDELPILLGVVPFGMIYGVLALGAGLSPFTSQAMSSVLFAGSAQLIATQLVREAVPPAVLVLTVFVVNLRHALYSASVAPRLSHLRAGWKALLAYLLTDEAYFVAAARYARDDALAAPPSPHRHWYFLGAGLTLWASWQASTAAGLFLGAQVPASWSLDFTLALTFIALVFPALKDRASLAAALAAGALGVAAYALPYKLGLMLAAVAGIVTGLVVEARRA
ncbi:MAG TPA: AzlC family ABC transporter permease [Anaeromyxobacteraceae bacterium]|nr:AzlC family ABC transporter permease [Anaeromyxobacteraceae bacterium]